MWAVRYKEVNLAWTFHVVPKIVSTITIVRYIGVFLRAFDRVFASSTKSVRYYKVFAI